MNFISNKFEEKHPFDAVRAEDFGEDLFEFYEPLEQIVRNVSGVNIEGNRHIIIEGGRGTGKTMVLKHLEFNMQLKEFLYKNGNKKQIENINKEHIENFLKNKKFIGTYIHIKSGDFDNLCNELESLFKPILVLKITYELLKILIFLKWKNLIESKTEKMIVEKFVQQIKKPLIENVDNFEDIEKLINDKLLDSYNTITNAYSTYRLNEIKKMFEMPIVLHRNIIFKLFDFIISNVKCLNNKRIFIIIDEVEYLTEFQTRYITQLIKDSDDTSITFKVGTRCLPKTLKVGNTDEILKEFDDYRKIVITDALNAAHSGTKSHYSNLIKNILNKRLQKSSYFKGKRICDIEQLIPNISIEKEARDIVSGGTKHWIKFKNEMTKSKTKREINSIIDHIKYDKNPLIEKLNMLLIYRGYSPKKIKKLYKDFLEDKNKEYKNLYNKNAFNLLIQLYHDYRKDKRYAGIDTYIYLSSGITRIALELCGEALNTAYVYGYKTEHEKSIDIQQQSYSAKKISLKQYDGITKIPKWGIKVQSFINQIGTIFDEMHRDIYLVEPEPTHFETDISDLSDKACNIFNAALSYEYIQKKPSMKPKEKGKTKREDFIINRIFAPHFNISYKIRGRTVIPSGELEKLLIGNEEEKNKSRKNIIKMNTRRERVLEDQSILEI